MRGQIHAVNIEEVLFSDAGENNPNVQMKMLQSNF